MSQSPPTATPPQPPSRVPPPMPPPTVQPIAGEAGEVGVYFRDEDYAGVMRRLMVDVLDVGIVGAISIAWLLVLDRFRDAWGGIPGPILAGGWAVLWFVYFVLLKRSTLRTVGYRVGGVRIVNLRGERPGIFALTVRLLFAVAGPFNFLIDLIWIGNDPNRQALRDKFARTYVVRRDAQPAGHGVVKYEYYAIMGTNFIFAEVGRAVP